MIEAKIILDSINPAGKRLTTWLLTYPRFIHSEFMTHRIFSRNAASSRAIPISKQMDQVFRNHATFEFWGKNQKGMQAMEELDEDDKAHIKEIWKAASMSATDWARTLDLQGAHKQIANRVLEPFVHMTVLATATDHSNFFKLRAHPAAQPEFQVLAYRMLSEYIRSQPQQLQWGEWHLPGVDLDAADAFSIEQKLKLCVALACRASYSAFEEPLAFDDANRIHDRGVEFGHWSPFEHPAQAISPDDDATMGAFRCYPWSNFDFLAGSPMGLCPSGWGQYRKLFPSECARGFSNEQFTEILNSRPAWVRV
jgi:thymidylate synthase ThyX